MFNFDFVIHPHYTSVVIFDLDDTVFDTEVAFVDWIWRNLGIRHVWKGRMNIRDPIEGPLLAPTLESAEFMRDGNFVPGFEKFPDLLAELRRDFPEVLFIFGSHRGYNPLAAKFTRQQFDRLGVDLPGVFLNPHEHPCKKTYFDNNLNGLPYLLFDDNPHWKGGASEKVDNILLMDKIWNQEETAYERIYSFGQMRAEVINRLWANNVPS